MLVHLYFWDEWFWLKIQNIFKLLLNSFEKVLETNKRKEKGKLPHLLLAQRPGSLSLSGRAKQHMCTLRPIPLRPSCATPFSSLSLLLATRSHMVVTLVSSSWSRIWLGLPGGQPNPRNSVFLSLYAQPTPPTRSCPSPVISFSIYTTQGATLATLADQGTRAARRRHYQWPLLLGHCKTFAELL